MQEHVQCHVHSHSGLCTSLVCFNLSYRKAHDSAGISVDKVHAYTWYSIDEPNVHTLLRQTLLMLGIYLNCIARRAVL